jgi:hypothetical protein
MTKIKVQGLTIKSHSKIYSQEAAEKWFGIYVELVKDEFAKIASKELGDEHRID